jgi:6-phosphogluconolactonase
VAVVGAKPEPRITLTYPALALSRNAAFLVAGEGKRGMLRRLLAGDPELPAAAVRASGSVVVFADRAAAAP